MSFRKPKPGPCKLHYRKHGMDDDVYPGEVSEVEVTTVKKKGRRTRLKKVGFFIFTNYSTLV